MNEPFFVKEFLCPMYDSAIRAKLSATIMTSFVIHVWKCSLLGCIG